MGEDDVLLQSQHTGYAMYYIYLSRILMYILYRQLYNYLKTIDMNEIGKAMHALQASCSEEQLALVSNLLLAMMPNDETTREMIVVRFMEVIEGLGS